MAFNWTDPTDKTVHNVRFKADTTLEFDRIGDGTIGRYDTNTISIVEV